MIAATHETCVGTLSIHPFPSAGQLPNTRRLAPLKGEIVVGQRFVEPTQIWSGGAGVVSVGAVVECRSAFHANSLFLATTSSKSGWRGHINDVVQA